MRIPLRWFAIIVLLFASSLNYLDRQLLAALAPTLMSEVHLSNLEYGQIHSVFSIVYAVTAPFAGLFVDRVGLNAGVSISVILWSLVSAATGLTRSFPALLGCRTVLGLAEAAGIPCFGKATGIYLEPRELALGTAFNQVGISLGMFAAPLIVAALAPRYGWRATFAVWRRRRASRASAKPPESIWNPASWRLEPRSTKSASAWGCSRRR